jgi:hypothetical protein
VPHRRTVDLCISLQLIVKISMHLKWQYLKIN